MTRQEDTPCLHRLSSASRDHISSILRSSTWAQRIIAVGLLITCVFPAKTTAAERYYPPPESKGGWRMLVTKNAAPTAAQKSAVLSVTGLDTDRIVDAWNYVESLGKRQSLIVIRHGWIVGEWDYVGTGPVNSCTKSLTGLALAKLFELSDAGRLPKKIGYDDLAYKYLLAAWSDADPRKKLIKVRDLPTMCSGLQAMDTGLRDLDMALSLPLVHPPETVDQYSSASTMLEGIVIENASSQSLSSFFRRYLSEPIGAESVRLWDAYGAAGYAFMQTRDLARFGYLVLRNGAWDNGRGVQQIVRPDLIAKCTLWPRFLTSVTDGPGNNTQWLTTDDPPSHFLHTWRGSWVNWSPDWPSSMRAVWPFVPKDAFWMSGYGKDICVVIPSLDMIIAHQTARAGGLEQVLNARPEFFSTLLSKVMAAVVTRSASPPAETTETVERWDTYERSLRAAKSYANPFQHVGVTVTFTHATGKTIRVEGFHDGGSLWKVRFMPTDLGKWTYATSSSDAGLNGKTGTLTCVAPAKPYLHGPLRSQGHHVVHVDGGPRFLVSTRLSCQFASPRAWQPLIAFLKANRINRVLFMMPGVDSQKSPVHNQRYLFAPGPDYMRYNVEAFRAIDAFIDTLRQADILASPYFYYDPRREVMWKMTPDQDRAYIRYAVARIGAFSNVMPVLANEVELKTTTYKDRAFDLKSHAWANEMGALLKSRAVFGQPVSVHNPVWQEFATDPSYFSLLKDWPFVPWTDFILKQVQVGSIGTASAMTDSVPQPKVPTYSARAYARRNQLLVELRRFSKPVIDEEPGYDMGGTASAWNSQTPETMRRTIWTAAVAGAYTVWGSTATYETGDPLPKMRSSATPPYLRVLHDVMTALPYKEMEPMNEAVTRGDVVLDGEAWRTNYALGKPGEAYLVYSLRGGTGKITLAPGRYAASRVDPRDGTQAAMGTVTGGTVGFSLPPQDWVLIYRCTAAASDRNAPSDNQ